ncbi:hypothetical protein WJX81_001853 [Elliptochloris bilobata]|uniref:Autophagy-related protein 2 n=1 Tax=Elliptochloris bilobata TaxID=381761 RepID=A0AAW1RTM3_9CHLO
MATFLSNLGTDWLLKRAFKFLLKRNLGCLLRNEVDLDMLNVALGRGTLELRSALLNTEYLNAQLGSAYWEVVAGYVGALSAEIPLTSLGSDPVSLRVEEALITAAVVDGVRLIAGGIEDVLQRLRIQVRQVILRIELPGREGSAGPPSLVVLRLDQLSYSGCAAPSADPAAAADAAEGSTSVRLQKQITFSGLTVELFEDLDEGPDAREPDATSFSQHLAHPCVRADLTLEPLQVQLHPTHLPLLLHLNDCLAAARAVEAAAAQPADAPILGGAPDQAPASRSFIEGMFVPDTTAFVTEVEPPAPAEGGTGGGWQLRVQTRDLSLVLWYPDAPGVPGVQGAICDYRPRLSTECGDLTLALEAGVDDRRMEAFLAPLALAQARAALLRMEEATPADAGLRGLRDDRCFAELALDAVLDDLQDLRTTAVGARVVGAGSAPAELRCWAPHVCAVLQLPAPPPAPSVPMCHGYGFAAVDVFAAPAAPAVPGEAAPMLLLRAGGNQADATGTFDVAAAIGHAKAYLVGSRFAGGGPAAPCEALQASCIADILPAASGRAGAADAAPRCAGAAIAIDVRWAPAASPDPALIDCAWAFVRDQALAAAIASTDGGGASGIAAVELQDAIVASSAVVVRVQAPEIRLWLSQADLAAVWHLADAVSRWRALYAPPLPAALPPPVQAAVLLNGGFTCSLQQARGSAPGDAAQPEFTLSGGDVRAFCSAGLGGALGAALAVVSASDARIAAGGGGVCLLHVPPAGAWGPGAPRMEVLSVHRPLLPEEQARHYGSEAEGSFRGAPAAEPVTVDGSEPNFDDLGPPDLCAEGTAAPAVPATAALAAATVRGATLAAEGGDLTLPWLGRLAALVAVGYAAEPTADAPAPAPLDLTLHLQDCALRHEPPEPAADAAAARAPVAAALLVGGAHVHVQPGEPRLELALRGLSLFCAEARSRGPAWAPSRPADLPRARLLDAGYCCIAQEGRIGISISPPAGPGGTALTEVSNDRLHLALTAPAARLALALGAQVAAGRARDGAGVRVMQDVQEDAFRWGGDGSVAASAFLGGGWLDPECRERLPCDAELRGASAAVGAAGTASPSSESPRDRFTGAPPPVIHEHFAQARRDATAGSGAAQSEERGRWYSAGADGDGAPLGPPRVFPEHVPTPPAQTAGFSAIGGFGRGALGPLPAGYPAPASRVVLRDLRLLLQLCAPPDEALAAPGEGAHAGTAPRVELEVGGLCLQADTFGRRGPHARRLAVSVHHAELRDCQPRSEGGAAWRRILGYHATSRMPRDASACLLQVELDAVRPGGGAAGEELRLGAALLPLRLRLDQAVVDFLQDFALAPSADEGDGEMVDWMGCDAFEPAKETAEPELEGEPFFQRAELRGLSVMVDYWPRRLDLAALKAGNLAEVLNLAPWGGVLLQLPPVRLSGVHGWPALGAAVGELWLRDIVGSQAHKFLTGFAPVRAAVRLGAAAGALLAIPAEQLRRDGAAPRTGAAPLSRQIQRGLTGLVRAILAEALGLSASALGGVQVVLTGACDTAAEQPAGVSEGLRVAAERLSSGFSGAAAALRAPQRRSDTLSARAVRALRAAPQALVAPLSGGAAAARAAILGARNALEPERYEDRRLAQ